MFFGGVATFSDVYDVFASKFNHFSHLPARLRAELVFKAKKVTFRERKTQNGGKVDFLVFLSRKFAYNMQSGFPFGICATSTLSDSFAVRGGTSSFWIIFLTLVRRICSKMATCFLPFPDRITGFHLSEMCTTYLLQNGIPKSMEFHFSGTAIMNVQLF